MNFDEISTYPLCWPVGRPRTKHRGRARFNVQGQPVSVWVGIERAEGELSRLCATSIILSTNLPTRQDGLPLSRVAEPSDPGVAIYFRLEREPHCLSCDRWDRVADNLAAISLHVDSIRGQLRWGVADVRQALAGFKALPGVRSPWQVLGFSEAPRDENAVKKRVRELALEHHPDRGGSLARMSEITAAAAECVAVLQKEARP